MIIFNTIILTKIFTACLKIQNHSSPRKCNCYHKKKIIGVITVIKFIKPDAMLVTIMIYCTFVLSLKKDVLDHSLLNYCLTGKLRQNTE